MSDVDIEYLERFLNELRKINFSKEFPDKAKQFQATLRESRLINRDQKNHLWNEQQSLWDTRKQHYEKKKYESTNAKYRYINEIHGIDYSYDGAPILQGFSNWENVGNKVRAAREKLKAISAALKADNDLLHNDRQEIRNLINEIWHKVKQSEETTYVVHGTKASDLYNEACSAVESLPIREARVILKAASADLRTLWLSPGDRDKFRSWFNELWSKLHSRREEAARRHEEWRSNQRERLVKLREIRDRLEDSLGRVRNNIDNNRSKYYDARTSDFKSVVEGWIREGEEQERDLERRIEELNDKIRSIEQRLDD